MLVVVAFVYGWDRVPFSIAICGRKLEILKYFFILQGAFHNSDGTRKCFVGGIEEAKYASLRGKISNFYWKWLIWRVSDWEKCLPLHPLMPPLLRRNYLTSSRFACTHLNASCLLKPKMAIHVKISIVRNFERLKIICTGHIRPEVSD